MSRTGPENAQRTKQQLRQRVAELEQRNAALDQRLACVESETWILAGQRDTVLAELAALRPVHVDPKPQPLRGPKVEMAPGPSTGLPCPCRPRGGQHRWGCELAPVAVEVGQP